MSDRKVPALNYVKNAFSATTESWTASGATLSTATGMLKITASSTTNSTSKTFTTTVGKRYFVRVLSDKGTAAALRVSGTGITTTTLGNLQVSNVSFTATGASTTVTLSPTTSGVYTYYMDRFELIEDHLYDPVVKMTSDYYPFGMVMPGRNTNLSDYRYGYTGKESDPEAKGNGNSYDFGNRQYDPRLGRWLSLDPLKAMYPSMTPYCYAGNTPICAKDPDGNFIIFVNGYIYGKKSGPSDDLVPGYEYWFTQKEWNSRIVAGPGSEVRQDSEFIKSAKKYFGDQNAAYVNGTGSDIRSTAKDRMKEGYLYAEMMEDQYRSMLATLGPDEKIEIVTHSMGSAFAEGMIEYFQKEAKDIASRITTVVHLSPADAKDIKIAANSEHIKRMELMTKGDNTIYWADWWTKESNRMIPGIDLFGYMHWSVWRYHNAFEKARQKKINSGKKAADPFDSHADTKLNPFVFEHWIPEMERAAKLVGGGYDGIFIGKIRFDRLVTGKSSSIGTGIPSGGSGGDDCEEECEN